MKRKALSVIILGIMLLSIASMPALAANTAPALATSTTPQLPDTVVVDGRLFVADISASRGQGSAEPDDGVVVSRSYTVLGSDVRMYIDYSHGHGGDQFAWGWVQATAPKFYARAEIRLNGQVEVKGTNTYNPTGSNIAESATPLAVSIDNNRKAHVFYGW